ncbi:MAG: type II secretion system F family protein [Eubacteriales bacterium]|nr:type II secretion system F family protein [Eubacteriales bacterium]MDD4323449.1 type II secretion system F family protein [Eubacteriales bacterium]MDD4540696.1 type II secretion system F family protein [Eubacteriales bacterium]
MNILVYAGLFVTLALWLGIIIFFIFRKSLLVRSRLEEIESISSEADAELDVSSLTGKSQQVNENYRVPVLGPYLRSVERKLTQAHVRIKPVEFVMISIVLAALMFILSYVLTTQTALSILIGILSYFLPNVFLSRARNKRSIKLAAQLPEFITVLANALRSGLGLNQAINSASNEMEDPIRWEFQKVMRDNSLGKPMEEALNDLIIRTGDRDIELLANAIIIQRQTGGNLSEILDMIAKTIRARIKLKGEVRTLTAQSRMSAVIISILPIAVAFMLSIINPDYLTPLIEDPLGRIMLIAVTFMMLLGMFFLNRITKIEV